MIVDPDLDEAYFIGNEEDNVAQDSESKWTLCFTEIYHLETKICVICGLFSPCLCDESSQYVAALGFTVVFSRPPTRSQVHGHRVEFRWER
jgi:hypothetical protein